ncbi:MULTISPECIES: flavin monoamine oxidase family protein [unclassified Mycolicibacterium]|uniref:flavin monoamine oxidase family protein n=1 Tax=unclassified Mycolicibacterium TaxID=2636767 RepID=UPI0013088856|nr:MULTISPECIES: flavin monoamine oxidase family protein [unclassified Mycolicibacterium]MUL80919.1 flavin monoamine oxidase family protein [Mycolicibacterium sp. CBMA 329]MUL86685.1 flavin monoamine oxidase family protein [Mycolicibacterium sp. CBMA 331]MUM02888.1 flavin monoamine oxidase family protein [Mycolicibacterium sp. CBMA 334]MUM29442.1 flavin monoamine oxidase family protein [Mycolicibacterium sp. CBMA 295]MUM36982.1 flavin monoamine oxidase family protein [Mycolicibacterium sp. CBM
MTFPTSTDVVVVGAGFAGLSAARALARLGHQVVVLEGRDRVGGRSSTTTIAGVPVDLGGTFVGPTQDAVLALADELGCRTVPTYDRGKNLILWHGRVRSYRSTIPRLSMLELFDVSRIQWRFERLSRPIRVNEPWNSPNAQMLDEQTLEEWLRSADANASTRNLMAIMSRVTWGAEPDEVSMLHAARYVKAAGGLDRMLDVRGGAQQDRFPGGTQQIALRMAEELGDRVVLDAPVGCIERRPDGTVTVGCPAGVVHARAVIVAVPPQHRTGIEFNPPLPKPYAELAANWPQGNLSKAYAAYDRPFWRANGCSGEALSDEGPVFITFDVSPGDGNSSGPGILLGFTDARTFDRLSPAQRREQALSGFATLFGDSALQPIDYIDHCWGSEQFAPGGPTAAVPPRSWTQYGQWLREPVDAIHWAGTETADEWTGFLDGAVRSGQRAAAEVADRLIG